jgi:hypothetical protein|nr:MAG TPA: hypothetical protein [Caudoviricetes sp.]
MEKAYARFLALRRKVMAGIKNALAIDCPCKSYEGFMELVIEFPDYFELGNSEEDAPNQYVVRLHCYVLGPARHYEWRGRTLDEALDAAEEEIRMWIAEVEDDE